MALGGDFQRGIVHGRRAAPEERAKVYIEGALQTRKWQGQDGQDRYSTEVLQGFNSVLTMLDGRDGGSSDDQVSNAAAPSRPKPVAKPAGGFAKPIDDEIPFAPEWRG